MSLNSTFQANGNPCEPVFACGCYNSVETEEVEYSCPLGYQLMLFVIMLGTDQNAQNIQGKQQNS